MLDQKLLPPGSSTVEITFTAVDGGTTVEVVHHGLADALAADHAIGLVALPRPPRHRRRRRRSRPGPPFARSIDSHRMTPPYRALSNGRDESRGLPHLPSGSAVRCPSDPTVAERRMMGGPGVHGSPVTCAAVSIGTALMVRVRPGRVRVSTGPSPDAAVMDLTGREMKGFVLVGGPLSDERFRRMGCTGSRVRRQPAAAEAAGDEPRRGRPRSSPGGRALDAARRMHDEVIESTRAAARAGGSRVTRAAGQSGRSVRRARDRRADGAVRGSTSSCSSRSSSPSSRSRFRDPPEVSVWTDPGWLGYRGAVHERRTERQLALIGQATAGCGPSRRRVAGGVQSARSGMGVRRGRGDASPSTVGPVPPRRRTPLSSARCKSSRSSISAVGSEQRGQ